MFIIPSPPGGFPGERAQSSRDWVEPAWQALLRFEQRARRKPTFLEYVEESDITPAQVPLLDSSLRNLVRTGSWTITQANDFKVLFAGYYLIATEQANDHIVAEVYSVARRTLLAELALEEELGVAEERALGGEAKGEGKNTRAYDMLARADTTHARADRVFLIDELVGFLHMTSALAKTTWGKNDDTSLWQALAVLLESWAND